MSESSLATLAPRVQNGEAKAVMPTLDTAPRDGTPFLSCDPRFGVWSLSVRRLRYVADETNGTIQTIDMGAWLHVDGIDDDWVEGDTDGSPRWCIAPDDCNNPKDRVWQPLPCAPQKGAA